MERKLEHKHVRVSPATHGRLLSEAALRGRKVWSLADELLSRALDELGREPYPPLPDRRRWERRAASADAADLPAPIVPQMDRSANHGSGR